MDVVGQTQDGKLRYQEGIDYPGVVAEITPYVGELPMPTVVFEFRQKQFMQDWLDNLNALTSKTQEDERGITAIQEMLNKPNAVWLEDVLAVAEIEDLEATFEAAYDDALNEFPELAATEGTFSGIPYDLRPLQWDAKLPWNGEKAITLKSGFFESGSSDESRHVIIESKFEAGETKRTRLSNLASKALRIADEQKTLDGLNRIKQLKAGPQTPEVLEELAGYNPELVAKESLDDEINLQTQQIASLQREKSDLERVSYGTLADLLANASVADVVKKLSAGIFATLKQKVPAWANLDLAFVASKYSLPPVD